MKPVRASLLAALVLGAAPVAHAASVTFGPEILGTSGAPQTGISTISYAQDGLQLEVVASNGGLLSTGGDFGLFAGLHIPGSSQLGVSFGTYTLGFSSPVDSITIEFNALNLSGSIAAGDVDPERIQDFRTPAGPVDITVIELIDAAFDGTSISGTADGLLAGHGSFAHSGPAFGAFAFDHSQDPSQSGFVLRSVTVTTVEAPEPTRALLAATALVGFAAVRRPRHP